MKQRYVARPGRAVTATTRRVKRRVTASVSSNNAFIDKLLQILRDAGIDTTWHRYKVKYLSYGIDPRQDKWRAPGDWFACLALNVGPYYMDDLDSVAAQLADWFFGSSADPDDPEVVAALTPEVVFSVFPKTVEGMAAQGDQFALGGGDTDLVELLNFDTKEKLYENIEWDEDEDW